MTKSSNLMSPKPHYEILDGLRGVAALVVIAFHLLEIHAIEPLYTVPFINHGYLAVDFFFLLSGFVIGYAYDDRWGKMSVGGFFKRRVIRLQPLVIFGAVLGAICFYFGSGDFFTLIDKTSVLALLVVSVLAAFLIPIPPSMDVRMWGEMYPTNGPAWSLLYEYIANILYGLFVRRFSILWLSIMVVLSGLALSHLSIFGDYGGVLGGHMFTPDQLLIGITRVTYPFFCGLLLFRLGKKINIRGGFLWASLALIAVLICPRIGGTAAVWQNGIFEALVILFLFPVIVLVGAGSKIKSPFFSKVCNFLGQISFPVYIVHYPIVYVYMAYAKEHNLSYQDTWPVLIALWFGLIVLAYGALKLFDEPVRAWLKRRFFA